MAQQLAEQYGIMTRAGLHCAPLAHETAGTLACLLYTSDAADD